MSYSVCMETQIPRHTVCVSGKCKSVGSTLCDKPGSSSSYGQPMLMQIVLVYFTWNGHLAFLLFISSPINLKAWNWWAVFWKNINSSYTVAGISPIDNTVPDIHLSVCVCVCSGWEYSWLPKILLYYQYLTSFICRVLQNTMCMKGAE